MSFTVATWNVENLRRTEDDPVDQRRAANVAAFLAGVDPDVFALLEVKGKEVFFPLLDQMPEHSFFITESARVLSDPQEILIGVRSGIQAFTTQRLQFRSGLPTMRPGALVTIRDGAELYPLLLLHLKSGPTAHGFGTRDDQVMRAFSFRTVLAEQAAAVGVRHGYVFAGDLNTMGMDLTHSDSDVDGAGERARLRENARTRDMRLLPKTHDVTWWNGGDNLEPSDLDHVVGGDQVQFADQNGSLVAVRGWPELADEADQIDWINDHSDHGLLFFEITGIA